MLDFWISTECFKKMPWKQLNWFLFDEVEYVVHMNTFDDAPWIETSTHFPAVNLDHCVTANYCERHSCLQQSMTSVTPQNTCDVTESRCECDRNTTIIKGGGLSEEIVYVTSDHEVKYFLLGDWLVGRFLPHIICHIIYCMSQISPPHPLPSVRKLHAYWLARWHYW